MIPQESSSTVTRALKEAFGVTQFENIRDLTEGPGSNRAFRIVVGEAPYLLRINTRPGDVARQFTCMRTASDAGLAPRVLYASVDDRISITDFVDVLPLSAGEARARIASALRTLHGLPPFPEVPFNTTCTFLLHKGPVLDGFVDKFRASNVLPEDKTNELLEWYEQLVTVHSRLKPDMTPAHNDLFKPDNMLFDGNRLWLVDWEAAFQNDRYADLAVVANMICTSEPEETAFLTEYFGEAPDDYRRARFYLMKQVAHVFYAMVYLMLGSSDKSIDGNEPVASYGDFQRRFWAREVNLGDTQSKAVFGRVHLEQLSQNMRHARFAEAVKLVSS